MSTITMLRTPSMLANYKNSMPSTNPAASYHHNGNGNNSIKHPDFGSHNNSNGIKMSSLPIMCQGRAERLAESIRLASSLPDLSSVIAEGCRPKARNGGNNIEDSIFAASSPFFPGSLPAKFDLEAFMLPLMMENLKNANEKSTKEAEKKLSTSSASTTSEGESVPKQEDDKQQQPPQSPRRRKNSRMAPVMPDFELMAKLQAEDEEKNKKDAALLCQTSTPDTKKVVDDDDDGDNQRERVPHLSRCDSCSEKESATAWLAAATTQLSPQLLRGKAAANDANGGTPAAKFSYGQCNLQYQNGDNWAGLLASSTPSPPPPAPASPPKPPAMVTGLVENKPISVAATAPKTLQPFKEDRVRRTSILRQSSPFVTTSLNNNNNGNNNSECKKKVSFADARGQQLESVRYFANSPQTLRRRYSSNTAPTYLTNCNSPWNYGVSNPWTSPITTRTTTTATGGKSQTLDDMASSLRRSSGMCNVNAAAAATAAAAMAAATLTTMMSTDSSKLMSSLGGDAGGVGPLLHPPPRYELTTTNFTSPSLQYNFSSKLEELSVLLHSLTTAETTIYGIVSVANRHFTKRVTVRYSFNNWKTYIEREGTYMLGSHDGRTDKFSFVIYARPDDFGTLSAPSNTSTSSSTTSLPNYFNANAFGRPTLSSTSVERLSFAIRYTTGDGQEYWDNNEGNNYCLSLSTY